jgi:hypothetical protein
VGLINIEDMPAFPVVDEYRVEDELDERAYLEVVRSCEGIDGAPLTVARTIVPSSHPAVFTTSSREYSRNPNVTNTHAKLTAMVTTARVLIETSGGRLRRSMCDRLEASMGAE